VDVDLDELPTASRVSFDCVLVGDDHRPKNDDFETGYSFETAGGTPHAYTGPAARVGPAYSDQDAFVTVLTITVNGLLTASEAAASGLEPGVPYEMMRSCYRDEEPAGGGVMRVRSGLKRSGTVGHATRW
jgi:hypothetical protein